MPTESPKAMAICNDTRFLENLKGTGRINAAKAEELARKARERHIDISFTCAGICHGNRSCTAQLRVLRNFDTPSFVTIDGSEHSPGCEYASSGQQEQTKHLSYRLGNFLFSDFHASMSKGKQYDNPALAGSPDLIDAQNLKEMYSKLVSARIDSTTQDGYQVKDIIIDSRTYMLHRQDRASIDGHPALVLGITTPLYRSTDFMTDETYVRTLILQDPFISPNNDPRKRMHYVLQFDGRHSSAFKDCYNAIIKVAKKQADDPDTAHMTNNAIFLIEADWKRITDSIILDGIGCRLAFKGVITNKKQFVQLDGTTSAEDPRQLYERTLSKEKPGTGIEQNHQV